jgi:hypothetical protein
MFEPLWKGDTPMRKTAYCVAMLRPYARLMHAWESTDYLRIDPNPKISAPVVGTSNDEEDRNHLQHITHLSPKLPLCGSTSLIWPLSIPSLLGDALECLTFRFFHFFILLPPYIWPHAAMLIPLCRANTPMRKTAYHADVLHPYVGP